MNPKQIFQDVQPATAPTAVPNPVTPTSVPPSVVPAPIHQPMANSNSPFSPSPVSPTASHMTQPAPISPQLNANSLPLPPTDVRSAPQSNPIQQTTTPMPPTNPSSQPNSVPNNPTVAATSIPSVPLVKTPIETPRPAATKKGWLQDLIGLAVFIIVVIVGAWLINMFVFRSFNVVGPSMEPTLSGGASGSLSANEPSDRLIVNLLPVTGSHIAGKDYTPSRGQIIVFKNPHFTPGSADEYIVKRVIGLPGERVTVNDCVLKVHTSDKPNGFNPYPDFDNLAENDAEINTCVAGNGTDVTVPDGEIFVVGDHRVNGYSMDSRDGDHRVSLGTIPLNDIVGPVTLRIWPIDQFTVF